MTTIRLSDECAKPLKPDCPTSSSSVGQFLHGEEEMQNRKEIFENERGGWLYNFMSGKELETAIFGLKNVVVC